MHEQNNMKRKSTVKAGFEGTGELHQNRVQGCKNGFQKNGKSWSNSTDEEDEKAFGVLNT